MFAHYRKFNDGSHNSSTYHKKDGTPVRAILKQELKREVETRGQDIPRHIGNEYLKLKKIGDYSPPGCPSGMREAIIASRTRRLAAIEEEFPRIRKEYQKYLRERD